MVVAFVGGILSVNSGLELVVLIGVLLLGIGLTLFVHAMYTLAGSSGDEDQSVADDRDTKAIDALDEATELFAGSLGVSDAFRLVSNNVKKIFPAHSTALMTVEQGRERLKIIQALGEHQLELSGKTVGLGDSIAGRSYYTNIIEIGRDVVDFGFPSAPVACIPIITKGSVIAIFQIYMNRGAQFTDSDYEMLEAIRIRISPLLTAAFGIDGTRANSLTDATTGLPNEKAFRLLLAKNVSETSRKSNIRPLSILSIDINDFETLNTEFGHAVGDRVLVFASETLIDGLRSMDLLARASGDEFLMIAPTATREACQDIMSRIHASFVGRRLKASEDELIELSLNIGWATYGEDGESVDELIRSSRARRTQSKHGAVPKIVWFPTERAEI